MSPPCHPWQVAWGGSRWLIPAEPRARGRWQCLHAKGARCAQVCRGDIGTWLLSPGGHRHGDCPLGQAQVRPRLSPRGTSLDGGWDEGGSGGIWRIFGEGSGATWMWHLGPGSVVALAVLVTPRWLWGSQGDSQPPSLECRCSETFPGLTSTSRNPAALRCLRAMEPRPSSSRPLELNCGTSQRSTATLVTGTRGTEHGQP